MRSISILRIGNFTIRRTPLFTAYLKIYLRRPEVVESAEDHQNQVNGPAVRELSPRPEQGTPQTAPEAIFGRNKQETLTISGRIVTKTVTYSEPVEVSGRTIEQK
jgi:hypothetical protein